MPRCLRLEIPPGQAAGTFRKGMECRSEEDNFPRSILEAFENFLVQFWKRFVVRDYFFIVLIEWLFILNCFSVDFPVRLWKRFVVWIFPIQLWEHFVVWIFPVQF